MVHRLLELVERVVFDQIEVGRGFNLFGKNNDDAHPRGARLFCESIYPHIVPGNRPSYPNHLSRVMIGMLVQLTKGCVNWLSACLRPNESAATQEENRNTCTRGDQLHFGGSYCCCCCGGLMTFWHRVFPMLHACLHVWPHQHQEQPFHCCLDLRPLLRCLLLHSLL